MIFCDKSCSDVELVKHFQYRENLHKENIRLILISESFPKNSDDYFDGNSDLLFIRNTNCLFNRNGCDYKTYNAYLNMGKMQMMQEDVGKALKILAKSPV